MNQRIKSLVLMTLLLAMGTVAVGQESLKDIVEQQGLAWMVGQWKATMDDGQEMLLTYRWAVNGYAVVSNFEMGNSLSQGMIYFDSDKQQVRQLTIDSRGQAVEATWDVQNGKAISKTKMIDEYGQITDTGFVFSRVDATTINVAVHSLQDGELSDNSWFDIDFKKQKKMTSVRETAGPSTAQESFKDIVEQQGFGWMLGNFKAIMDDGQEMLLTYRWAVRGQAIISSFKMGNMSSLGMIHLDMDAEQAKQISVDSRGQATKATWEIQGDEAISKTTMTDEYGQVTNMGIVHSKVDDTTINIALYGLEDGKLSDDSWFDINFKKQKK